MAIPLLVLEASGSVAQMGLLTAVASVGSVVTGLFAGVLVDRLDRRKLMIWCDVARIVLFGLVPVCWLAGPQVWLLYVVMALSSIFDMVFEVAYVTVVANLVDVDRLVIANGRLQSTNAIAYIVGPALAGIVASIFGATSAIGLDALTFAVSALGLSAIRLRIVPRTAESVSADLASIRRSFLQGFVFIWRNELLRTLTILLTLITFFSLGLADVFIYDVRHALHNGNEAVGVVLGLASAGSILAASLAPVLRKSLGFGGCWLGSFALCGIAVVFAGLSTNVATLSVTATLFSFGSTLAGVCSMTLRQEITPDYLLGRVTSAFWTFHSALGPIGAAVITLVVARAGVKLPLIAIGAAFLAIVLAGLWTPIRVREPRRREPSPDWTSPPMPLA